MAKDSRRETGSATELFKPVVDKKALLAQVAEGGRLYQAGDYKAAKQVFLKARHLATRAGIRSGTIEWGLATCHDQLQEAEQAVEYILAALALDPFDGAYNHSFGVIAGRLRQAVAFGEEQGDGAEVERFYGLLLRIGEADVAAHLVAARHFLGAGRAPEAVRILSALTVLSPSCSQAWALLVDAASAVGDFALADRARVETACCHDGEAIPTNSDGKRALA